MIFLYDLFQLDFIFIWSRYEFLIVFQQWSNVAEILQKALFR
jgi:hypothetical protein